MKTRLSAATKFKRRHEAIERGAAITVGMSSAPGYSARLDR